VRLSPFIARDAQLAALGRDLKAAEARGGRVGLVVGEPGIGKSRLLDEFARLNRRRALVLSARGSPISTASPFSVFAEALESHLRHLTAAQMAALCPARLGDLREVLPSVEIALPSGPDVSRLRVLEAFRCLLEELASSRPLVLLLDDLHQADPSSWELLNYLGRNPPAAPVLILGAMRQAEVLDVPQLAGQVATLLRDQLAAELRLPPFDLGQVGEIADRVLPGPGDPDLGRWLFSRARGNPLYTIALLAELADDPSRRVVPVSVKESVRLALRELTPGSRAVVEAAAVIGHSFDLAAILAMVPAAGSDDLDHLVAKNLIAESPRPGVPGYDFVHPVVQEAMYSELGPARRRELHLLAARELAGAPLATRAYHVGLGALPGDVGALDLLRDAAREAERSQAHREALVHLQRALELASPGARAQRRQLLDEVAWQAGAVGDHVAGIAALGVLRPLVENDPAELARTHARLASFLATGAGDMAAAEQHARAAIDLLSKNGLEKLLAAPLNELAWIHGEDGDLARQARESLAAADLARQHGPEEVLMHALGCRGHALALMGDSDGALSALGESCAMARAAGDRAQTGWHTGVLAEALFCAGRMEDASELLDELLEGEQNPSDVAYDSRARLNWFLGRWEQSLADARMVQALQPSTPSIHSAWALSLAGMLLIGMGRSEAAAPFLAQGDRIYRGRDFYIFSAWNDWATGHADWFRGDLDSAVLRLQRSVSRLETMGASAAAAQVLPDVAQIERARGRDGEADAWELRARAAAPPGVDWFDIPIRRARALEDGAGRASGPQRREALAAAARVYAALPSPFEERRIIARLRGSGPAGRREALRAGSLTNREGAVAQLAASGWSTREIATRLGIGERTVETHLSHVYAKLGIAGRHDLAAG
jgi:DNA-binding CsgD family transcriptional regulator/tetratricopeptide (TPR) repeat protein